MIYLLYIPLTLIGLIMASGAIYRAWSRGVPRVYWLAAFWLLFSVHFAFQPPAVIYVSMVFLAIYCFATWLYGSNLARKYEKLRPIIGEAGEAPMTWFKAAALGEMSSRRKVEAKAQVSSKQEQEKAQKAVAKNKRIALDFTL